MGLGVLDSAQAYRRDKKKKPKRSMFIDEAASEDSEEASEDDIISRKRQKRSKGKAARQVDDEVPVSTHSNTCVQAIPRVPNDAWWVGFLGGGRRGR